MSLGDGERPAGGRRIEVFRGANDEPLASELVDFLISAGGLAEEHARARIAGAVCALRDAEGAVAAVSTVHREPLQMLANLPFWIYSHVARGSLDPETDEELLVATRDRLAAEPGGAGPEGRPPVGICRLVPPELAAIRQEAVWPRSGLLLVGYTRSREQVRIRYFDPSTRLP